MYLFFLFCFSFKWWKEKRNDKGEKYCEEKSFGVEWWEKLWGENEERKVVKGNE